MTWKSLWVYSLRNLSSNHWNSWRNVSSNYWNLNPIVKDRSQRMEKVLVKVVTKTCFGRVMDLGVVASYGYYFKSFAKVSAEIYTFFLRLKTNRLTLAHKYSTKQSCRAYLKETLMAVLQNIQLEQKYVWISSSPDINFFYHSTKVNFRHKTCEGFCFPAIWPTTICLNGSRPNGRTPNNLITKILNSMVLW